MAEDWTRQGGRQGPENPLLLSLYQGEYVICIRCSSIVYQAQDPKWSGRIETLHLCCLNTQCMMTTSDGCNRRLPSVGEHSAFCQPILGLGNRSSTLLGRVDRTPIITDVVFDSNPTRYRLVCNSPSWMSERPTMLEAGTVIPRAS